ncbi:MAG: gamma subclass chorismate mutase AroQ [Simkaniaceae bacterium]
MKKSKNIFKSLLLLAFPLLLTPLSASEFKTTSQNTEIIESQVSQIDDFLVLIQKRLALTDSIAKWKWNRTRPILNEEAEQKLLNQVAEKASEKGLNPESTKHFFRDQIEVAKLIQISHFENWSEEKVSKHDEDFDLNEDLIPQMQTINEALLSKLVSLQPLLEEKSGQALLYERAQVVLKGYPKEVIDTSVHSLLDLQPSK